MKTINSQRNQLNRHFELFMDAKTNKYCGFSGIVRVNDKDIYVNTRGGTGYDKVIEELSKLVDYLARKYRKKGYSFEDNKQNVMLHILEGIPKYNPLKNTKLSTFIQMRVEKRLINEIRNESRLSKNATFLNTHTYSVHCECGHNYTTTITKRAMLKHSSCGHCKRNAEGQKVFSVSNPEVSLETVVDRLGDGDTSVDVGSLYSSSMSDLMQGCEETSLDEEVISSYDLKKWLDEEDPRVAKIIELVCFKDYSIKAAAEQVGLTGAGANIKLKELKNKKIVRELFGR